MLGGTLGAAGAAARTFVAAKAGTDRIAVVTFGSSAVQATGFSTGTFEARSALSSLAVDRVQGTALYDAVELAAQALAADTTGARVLVVLTDGDDVSSASLASAISAAREAEVTVYPIGLESKSFDPPRCAAWRRPAAAHPQTQATSPTSTPRSPRGCGARGNSYLTSVRPGEPSSRRRRCPRRSHRAWRAPGRRSRRCPAGSSTSARSRSPDRGRLRARSRMLLATRAGGIAAPPCAPPGREARAPRPARSASRPRPPC